VHTYRVSNRRHISTVEERCFLIASCVKVGNPFQRISSQGNQGSPDSRTLHVVIVEARFPRSGPPGLRHKACCSAGAPPILKPVSSLSCGIGQSATSQLPLMGPAGSTTSQLPFLVTSRFNEGKVCHDYLPLHALIICLFVPRASVCLLSKPVPNRITRFIPIEPQAMSR